MGGLCVLFLISLEVLMLADLLSTHWFIYLSFYLFGLQNFIVQDIFGFSIMDDSPMFGSAHLT